MASLFTDELPVAHACVKMVPWLVGVHSDALDCERPGSLNDDEEGALRAAFAGGASTTEEREVTCTNVIFEVAGCALAACAMAEGPMPFNKQETT